MDWLTFVVADPVKAMFVKIWSYVPSIAGAIVILVVGWLAAKFIEAVITRILKVIQLDAASEKAGVAKVLAQGDIKMTLSEVIGAVVYWLIVLVVLATALDALNLKIASALISKLAEYVPSILAAIFILVIGTFLANFVGAVVRTAGANAGIKNAKTLGQIAQIVLVIFTVVAAIEQLKVATALIVLGINIILMAIGLGLALAFGLGCKDLAAKAMQNFLDSMKK